MADDYDIDPLSEKATYLVKSVAQAATPKQVKDIFATGNVGNVTAQVAISEMAVNGNIGNLIAVKKVDRIAAGGTVGAVNARNVRSVQSTNLMIDRRGDVVIL